MKYTLAILAAIMLASCNNVSLVSNRNPDGTFFTPVSPKTGAPADVSATFYRFKSGDYGITVWSNGLPVAKSEVLKLLP